MKKFLNSISSLFKKVEEIEEEIEEPATEPIPPPRLPDEIEIPWEAVASITSLQQYCDGIDEKMKEAFYKHKWEERNLFHSLQQAEDALKEKISQLYIEFEVSSRTEFEVLLPQTIGKPGKFSRRKIHRAKQAGESSEENNKPEQ